MNGYEALRTAFEEIPVPDDRAMASARTALLRAIAASEPAVRRPRRTLRLAIAVSFVSAAVLTGVTVFIGPREHGLTGNQIAAAAYQALLPPKGVVRHLRTLTRQGNESPVGAEMWVSSAPFATRFLEASGSEWEVSQCGMISFNARLNLLVVTVWPPHRVDIGDYQADLDPLARFLAAYQSGGVSYRRKTTYHGIPAYELAVTDPPGATTTYLVRRNDYYPLQTITRSNNVVSITGYRNLPDVRRTRATEQLLHIRPRPNAVLLHGGGFSPKPPCVGFGSYASVTGKGKKP